MSTEIKKEEKLDLSNLRAIVYCGLVSLATLLDACTQKKLFEYQQLMAHLLDFEEYKVLAVVLAKGAESSVLPIEIAQVAQLCKEYQVPNSVCSFVPCAGQPVHLKLNKDETKVIIPQSILIADRVDFDQKTGEPTFDLRSWPHWVDCQPRNEIKLARRKVEDISLGDVASTVTEMSTMAIEKRFKNNKKIVAIDTYLWQLNPTIVCSMNGIPTGIMGVHATDSDVAMKTATEKLIKMFAYL